MRPSAGGEQGSAVVEFVFLGVLLLVPLVYLVLTLARVQAGSYAVVAAAREAARAYVTADSEEQAPGRARAAASVAFADLGFEQTGTVELSCPASPCLTPEGVVTARATVVVPLPLVPAFARDVVPLAVPLSSTARGTVDRFRVLP